MCVCPDKAWSEEQAQVTVTHFGSGHCKCHSGSCEDDHGDPAQSTRQCQHSSASLWSSLHCKNLYFSGKQHSDIHRTVFAHKNTSFWVQMGVFPCTHPDESPALQRQILSLKHKIISRCISTVLVLPAPQLVIRSGTAHTLKSLVFPYLSVSDPVISKDVMDAAEILHLSGSQTGRGL